jgi:hypothetical protein
VATGALNAAGRVEFRKYADEHWAESAKRRAGTQAQARRNQARVRNESRKALAQGR